MTSPSTREPEAFYDRSEKEIEALQETIRSQIRVLAALACRLRDVTEADKKQ